MDKVATFLEAKSAAYPEAKSFRTKQMLNRFVIDMESVKEALGEAVTYDSFTSWTQGGLVNQKKKPQEFNHLSLEESLTKPLGRYTGFPMVTPQHMNQELWEKGVATDIHIFWGAVLEYFEKEGSWP